MKSRQTDQDLFESLRRLLQARAALVSRAEKDHPSTSELATFFYGTAPAPKVATHVAACQSCAAELALYAQAERAAAGTSKEKTVAKIPAAAWQQIRDWEESDFAKPKVEQETSNAELLSKLARLVATRKDFLQARKSVTARAPNRVPVVVVNRSGELRGVEVFERAANPRGEWSLVHADHSPHFDNVEIHALVYQSGKTYNIESYRIERDKARLGPLAKAEPGECRADFFIIED